MALLSGQPVRLVDPEGFLAVALEEYTQLFHREDDLDVALARDFGPHGVRGL